MGADNTTLSRLCGGYDAAQQDALANTEAPPYTKTPSQTTNYQQIKANESVDNEDSTLKPTDDTDSKQEQKESKEEPSKEEEKETPKEEDTDTPKKQTQSKHGYYQSVQYGNDAMIALLEREVQTSKNDIDRVMNKYDARLEQAKNEFNALQQKFNIETEEKAKIAEKLEEALQQYEELKSSQNEATEQHNEQVTEFKRRVSVKIEQTAQYEIDIANYKETIDSLNEKISDLESQTAKVNELQNKITEMNYFYNNKIESLQDALNLHSPQPNQAYGSDPKNEEIARLKTQIYTMKNNESESVQLKAKLQKAEELQSKSNKAMQEMKAEMKEMSDMISGTNFKENSDLGAELEQLKSENEQLREISSEHEQCEETIAQLKAKNNEIQQQNYAPDAANDISELQQQIESLESENKALQKIKTAHEQCGESKSGDSDSDGSQTVQEKVTDNENENENVPETKADYDNENEESKTVTVTVETVANPSSNPNANPMNISADSNHLSAANKDYETDNTYQSDNYGSDNESINEYTVTFEAKPFGLTFGSTQGKGNLCVTKVASDSAAAKQNVIIASKIVQIMDENVENKGAKNIYKMITTKYKDTLPLTITFRKPGGPETPAVNSLAVEKKVNYDSADYQNYNSGDNAESDAKFDTVTDANQLHEWLKINKKNKKEVKTLKERLASLLTERTKNYKQKLNVTYSEEYGNALIRDIANVIGKGVCIDVINGLLMTSAAYDATLIIDSIHKRDIQGVADIICCRSRAELKALRTAYKKKAKLEIKKQLQALAQSDNKNTLVKVIGGIFDNNDKSDDSDGDGDSVDMKQVSEDLNFILKEKKFRDASKERLVMIFTANNCAFIQALNEQFSVKTRQSIIGFIDKKLGSKSSAGYFCKTRIAYAIDTEEYYAQRIKSLGGSYKKNQMRIANIFVQRMEIDLNRISQVWTVKKYGGKNDLKKWVTQKTSDYYDAYFLQKMLDNCTRYS